MHIFDCSCGQAVMEFDSKGEKLTCPSCGFEKKTKVKLKEGTDRPKEVELDDTTAFSFTVEAGEKVVISRVGKNGEVIESFDRVLPESSIRGYPFREAVISVHYSAKILLEE